jgi:hypothetical protein
MINQEKYLEIFILILLFTKKEIENKNLDKFLNFFETDDGNNTESNRKVLTEGLNSPIKDKLIRIITSYKLIQDYNLLEGFKRYLKLKDIDKY